MSTARRSSLRIEDPARSPSATRRGPTVFAPGSPGGRYEVARWHSERRDPDFAEERRRLDIEIRANAVAWAVAFVSSDLIDRINILQATLLASQLAAARLPVRPDALLLDAVSLPELGIHQRTLIGADRLCASVAAASVVAKVARDRLMEELAAVYPGYDLASNKGYAAPEHRAGLVALGLCPIHRLSFAPCRDREQMALWDDAAAGVDVDADETAESGELPELELVD